jgi:protein arginine kinase activator
MKCEHCDKREATVHLTEIKKGVKQEMHLCEHCASEKGLPGKAHFSVSELLAGITSSSSSKKQGKEVREVCCANCELSLSQFQSSGRFGCPDCYDSFKDDILPLVVKIHDSSQHVGKVPRRVTSEVSMQTDIRKLNMELKRTVKAEDYEKAAELRDRIRKLEEALESGKAEGEAGGEPKPAEPETKKKRTRKTTDDDKPAD